MSITSEIPIPPGIQEVLNRRKIKVREGSLTIRHPRLGATKISPSVYAVYLALVKANYITEVLSESSLNKRREACLYFSAMAHDSDYMPSFSHKDVANAKELIEEADADYGKCWALLTESGCYELID